MGLSLGGPSVSLGPKNRILGALGLPGASDFAMRDLWGLGEQGAWYDPSDLSTLFQDAAGTTPVTAMEQPVGLMLDKRLGLVRGAEVVPDPALDNPAAWQTNSGATVVVAGGKCTFTGASTAANLLTATEVTQLGKTYEMVVDVESISQGSLRAIVSQGTSDPIALVPGVNKMILTHKGSLSTPGVYAANSPTTAVIRSISVREIPGNHASQATTAAKPVLSARKNLLVATEDFTQATWSKANTTATAGGITETTAAATNHAVHQTLLPAITMDGATPLLVRFKAKPNGRHLLAATFSGLDLYNTVFNLDTGTLSSFSPSSVVATITGPDADGYYTCTNRIMPASGTIINVVFNLHTDPARLQAAEAYTGDGVSGVFLKEVQVEYGSTATRYQRVNTATDYDWAGFPMYLKFDGVDDFLQTGNIDFTATDKMTVVAGVRKLSDAAAGMIAELSSGVANVGMFLLASHDVGGREWSSSARGSQPMIASLGAYDATLSPDTAVISATHDIAGDLSRLRRNGVYGVDGPGDKGTGNFGNYPLYIGRRGGASVPFYGYLYQLGIRGALTEDAKLKSWERNIGNKTGVTIA